MANGQPGSEGGWRADITKKKPGSSLVVVLGSWFVQWLISVRAHVWLKLARRITSVMVVELV